MREWWKEWGLTREELETGLGALATFSMPFLVYLLICFFL